MHVVVNRSRIVRRATRIEHAPDAS